LQLQWAGFSSQESVKTKNYGACLFLDYSFTDFLQVHLVLREADESDCIGFWFGRM
jgi:hypothetical protein